MKGAGQRNKQVSKCDTATSYSWLLNSAADILRRCQATVALPGNGRAVTRILGAARKVDDGDGQRLVTDRRPGSPARCQSRRHLDKKPMRLSCRRQIYWRTVRQQWRAPVIGLLVAPWQDRLDPVWTGRISVSCPTAIANPQPRSATDRRSTTHRDRAGRAGPGRL